MDDDNECDHNNSEWFYLDNGNSYLQCKDCLTIHKVNMRNDNNDTHNTISD